MDEIFKAQGEASERPVFAPRLHEEPTERENDWKRAGQDLRPAVR